MNFEKDAFISYAHLDNLELIEGGKGWVTNLHRALEIRLAQLLGKRPEIWRDPKLSGNDVVADVLVERLRRVAALVSVVSPRYVKSEWTRKELSEFWKAAEEQGGVRFRDKARIFKVLKTPVPLEMHPPELQTLIGYQFFKVDPDSGRVYELNEVFGSEAQRDFWLRLDDLAHDICCMLEILEAPQTPDSRGDTPEIEAIFLAEVTSDLREQRETLRRDLQQHGYTVLPTRALPLVVSELREAIREDMARCRLSIHLVGKSYGFVPEASDRSILEIQNELAIARGEQGGFSRLLWLPSGLEVTDERQRKMIEQLRTDPGIQKGADLLETSVEDLRTVIHEHLKGSDSTPTERTEAGARTPSQLYLVYDQRDANRVAPWADYLFEQGFEVLHPAFTGDEAEIREYHDENLRTCDAALILYGGASECWLRRKLREFQKSAGYGRTKPQPIVAVSLVVPKTEEKERFRTHEALVIPQFDGFSPGPLQPFISRLKV
ncbi:MAG: DUF4062 domain-containing protein [Candidatus Acidiferrales bacterium]